MNRDTAQTQQLTNMIDQNTPTGSLAYNQTGENTFTDSTGKTVTIPKFTATTSLSPGQQQIFDQTQGAEQNLAATANQQSAFLKDYLGKQIDLSGAPALQTQIGGGFSGNVGGSFSDRLGGNYKTAIGNGYSTSLDPDYVTSYAGNDDFTKDRDLVTDTLKARQQPDLDKATSDLETQLIGRGLRPGTAAWNSELDRNSRANNDANMAAIIAGGQEQSRLVELAADSAAFKDNAILGKANFTNGAALDSANFGNQAEMNKFTAQNTAALSAADMRNNAAATQANFQNNARTQYNTEAYAKRQEPIQEISALLGGSQVQSPNFQSTPQANVAGVDYSGLVSDKYKADTAAYQSTMGGLFGLLGAGVTGGFSLSDRRLKTDIRKVGVLDNGLPVYSYRMIGSPVVQIGLMADEVERVRPEAVAHHATGFKMVDYSMATEAA